MEKANKKKRFTKAYMSDLPEIDPVKSEVERISRIVAKRVEISFLGKPINVVASEPMAFYTQIRNIRYIGAGIRLFSDHTNYQSKHGKMHQVICGAYGPQGRRYSQNRQQEPLGL